MKLISVLIISFFFSIGSYAQTKTREVVINGYKATVKASSVLLGKTDKQYSVVNAFDNDLTTAWVEGNKGDGEGEWIEITFHERQLIKEIIINNGYQKSKETFKKNNRIDEVTLYVDDQKTLLKTDFYRHKVNKFKRLRLNQFAKTIKIEINLVTKGTHYQDLCISDIGFVFSDDKFQNAIVENIPKYSAHKNIVFEWNDDRIYVLNQNMIAYDLQLKSRKVQSQSLFEHQDFIDFYAEEVKSMHPDFPFYIVRIYLKWEYDIDTYLNFIPKSPNSAIGKNIFHESSTSNDGSFNYEMTFVKSNKDSYYDIHFRGTCDYSECGDIKNEVIAISKKDVDGSFTLELK